MLAGYLAYADKSSVGWEKESLSVDVGDPGQPGGAGVMRGVSASARNFGDVRGAPAKAHNGE